MFEHRQWGKEREREMGGLVVRQRGPLGWVSSRCQSPIIRISRVQLSARTSPRFQNTMADDADMMAMMGITGFGKQTKKRELDPGRFEKNRREEVGFTRAVSLLRVVLITYFSLGHPCHTGYSIGVVDNPTRCQRRTREKHRFDRTTEEAWPHPP